MPLEDSTSRAQYETNGTTGPWTVPYYFLASSHLQVTHTDSDGDVSTLVLDVDYSVSGAGNPAGGSVTTVTAFASGGYITILRDVPLTQLTDFEDADAFPASANEDGLDKLTMIAQQHAEVLSRALVFAPSETIITPLPAASVRASKLLGFDAEGQISVTAPVSGSAAELAIGLAANAGAGLIGYNVAESYAAGTVGAALLERVSVVSLGADPTGVADSAAAFQDALDYTSGFVFVPPGTYRIGSTLVWDGNSLGLHGNGGFASQLLWDGAAGGTMLETTANLRHMSQLVGVYFNANGASGAGKLLHFKKFSRGTVVQRCLFANCTTGDAIRLGDNATDGLDADIAQFSIRESQFFDNKHGIYFDSTNAAGVNVIGSKMTRISQNITSHIRMERGGSVSVRDTYFGGYGATGDEYAIYIKNGWGTFDFCESEFGLSPNNGGFLYLDTPGFSDLTEYRRTRLSSSKILGRGDAAAANYVRIASASHPLLMFGNAFQGKSTLTTYAVNNAGGARVLSIDNFYLGRLWTSAHQATMESIGDTFSAGTPVSVPPVIGTMRTVTSADSPVTIVGETVVRSNGGAVELLLPSSVTHIHQGGGGNRRLTVVRTAAGGATTLTPTAGETINGASSLVMAAGAEHTIELMSNGSGIWEIVGWYVENAAATVSSGTGTVKMGNANSADSAGWLEIAPGKFVPYWSDATP